MLRLFRYGFSSRKEAIIQALKLIKLEDGSDIYTKGFVSNVEVINESDVTVELKLT